ncbi:MAG: PHP domain-containing protein [Anaerolineae bacterium]|nr:PHP domain-containing protein [Anaerolineae bacterium]
MKTVYEYTGNLHVHTTYSDGTGTHADIAQAAIRAGLDFVIVTDHNVHVSGVEGYYYGQSREERVLLLVGEEIHDVRRESQSNHMLVYGVEQEMAQFAPNPQRLIDEINKLEGFCYLAHPIERAAPLFEEGAIPWVEWDIEGYTGIELWNYMSEFKSYLSSKTAAVRAAFNPEKVISGPYPETLSLWDELQQKGKQIKAIGAADAHATSYSMGPLTRVVFPYDYLFRCVNTHILTPSPLTGNFEGDKKIVLNALKEGLSFVGYDLPASTRGFRFIAQGQNIDVVMGEWIRLGQGLTMQIVLPSPATMRLLKDGEVMLQEVESTHRTYIVTQPGIYRAEAYINYQGKSRGWIFSNPIFVMK